MKRKSPADRNVEMEQCDNIVFENFLMDDVIKDHNNFCDHYESYVNSALSKVNGGVLLLKECLHCTFLIRQQLPSCR